MRRTTMPAGVPAKRFATRSPLTRTLLFGAVAIAGLSFAHPAAAQVTFDIIGPGEYNLPVSPQPWNVFVQYGTIQNTNDVYNASGDSTSIKPEVSSVVGLSKWVHFFTVDSIPNVGFGFEVIVPEVAVRVARSNGAPAHSVSGFGDPISGIAFWYKPTAGSTLGFQSFIQAPVGSSDVSSTNWKNLSSLLWYVPLGANFDWTGDAGIVYQTRQDDGTKPGLVFHTNNRFGYKVNAVFEPFVGLDYQHVNKSSVLNGPDLPSAYEFEADVGAVFSFAKNQSMTVAYARGIDGKNFGQTNAVNLKYVYVF